MQLYWIRHAQSTNNLLWDVTGSSAGRSEDPELTEAGLQQASCLAHLLKERSNGFKSASTDARMQNDLKITHVYCSLMLRAVRTADEIGKALNLPVVAWPEVHENGGIYLDGDEPEERIGLPGKPRSFFEKHFPNLILPEGLDEAGWWDRSFETEKERSLRADCVLRQLLNRHGGSDDSVAVVSHGAFTNLLISTLLKLPEEARCWFVLNNTSITRLDFNDNGIDVVYVNRIDYLPVDLIT